MLDPRLRWLLSAAFLSLLLLHPMQSLGFFEAQERYFFDLYQGRNATSDAVDPDLALVEITDECVEAIGKWPWPRSRVGDLIEALMSAGVKVLGIDILYVDPDPVEDPRLVQVLEASNRVILASEVHRESFWDNEAGALSSRLSLAPPIPALARAARGLGFVNVDFFEDNQDGVLRRMPLALSVDGNLQSVLALETVARGLGEEVTRGAAGELRLGGRILPHSKPPFRPPMTADEAERDFLRVPYELGAYLQYDRGVRQGAIPIYRAEHVLAGKISPHRLKGRTVFLGLNLSGLDQKITPIGTMPGVEVQAQLAKNLLEGRLLRRNSWAVAKVLLTLAVLLGVSLGASGSTLVSLVWLALAAGLFLVSIFQAAKLGRYWIDGAAPITSLFLGWLVARITVLSMGLRRYIRQLETLHESSNRLSRSLDLSTLLAEVADRYRELFEADASAAAFKAGDRDSLEIFFTERIPDPIRALLSRHRLQSELLEGMRVSDGSFPLDRLGELSDCPEDFEPASGSFLLPLGRFDEASGFVYLEGVQPQYMPEFEPHRFWVTHASTTATALENAALYRRATVDALTGLFLRHYFDSFLSREFRRAGRYQGHLALLMTDIDHFKKFNDTHGHQVGDEVLRFVAESVRSAVRNVDVPCRYGGEEFGVILPETDYEGALLTAERIRRKVEEAVVETAGKKLSVTISIGLSCTDRSHAQSFEAFVHEADQALYRAKEAGRNRVEAWEPETTSPSQALPAVDPEAAAEA